MLQDEFLMHRREIKSAKEIQVKEQTAQASKEETRPVCDTGFKYFLESLILAQDKRWRRA